MISSSRSAAWPIRRPPTGPAPLAVDRLLELLSERLEARLGLLAVLAELRVAVDPLLGVLRNLVSQHLLRQLDLVARGDAAIDRADDRSFDMSFYPGFDAKAARESLYNDLPSVDFSTDSTL